MDKSKFVYVTYIRTTPEKLWKALLTPEFTRRYWVGATLDSEWTQGASWRLTLADGTLADQGEVLEVEPQSRFVLSWHHEMQPELHAEGWARMTCELEQQDDVMKLTVVHEIDVANSKLIEGVSGGWPLILAGLKTLLETDTVLRERKAA